MDKTKPKRGNIAKHICRQTCDHVHYPPTRRTKPTRPSHAASQNLFTLLKSTFKTTPKYGECRKNQAVDNTTAETYDGCGEFVSGEEDDPMMCAACGCHRRFHCEESHRSGEISNAMILDALKISSDRFRQIFLSPYDDGDDDVEEKEEIYGKEKKIPVDRSNGGDSTMEDKVVVDRSNGGNERFNGGSDGGDITAEKKVVVDGSDGGDSRKGDKVVLDRSDGRDSTMEDKVVVDRSNGGDSPNERFNGGSDGGDPTAKKKVVVDGSNGGDSRKGDKVVLDLDRSNGGDSTAEEKIVIDGSDGGDLTAAEEIYGGEKIVADGSNGGDLTKEKIVIDISDGGDSTAEEEESERGKTKFMTEQTEKIVVDKSDGGDSSASKIYESNGGDSTKEIYGRDKRKIVVDGSNGGDLTAAKKSKTKFTADQTEKMRIKAEKLTWKLGSENKKEIEKFCEEIGVNIKNFRIWVNNHKDNHQ
ncbi:unnamed protein product [Cochlearia groenlandica]